MEDKIRKEMMSYYNERAEEYDEIYGGIFRRQRYSTIDPRVYLKDVCKTSEMVSGFGKGHLIDIACGPGFWLPNYARNCSKITLLDQSERMLKECTKRIKKLGLVNLTNLIQGDFFVVKLEISTFDSALIGFLLSHFTSKQEEGFFLKLKKILKPNGLLMFIDSAWNNERQKYRKKEGVQERVLNDGRIFKIYKRYFDKLYLEEMFNRNNFKIKTCYVGLAIISVIAESF